MAKAPKRLTFKEKCKKYWWFNPKNIITQEVLTYTLEEKEEPCMSLHTLTIRPKRGKTTRC